VYKQHGFTIHPAAPRFLLAVVHKGYDEFCDFRTYPAYLVQVSVINVRKLVVD